MSAATTFDSTKEFLVDLLKSIQEGKTQLPDFQRGWVWDDEHIRSLLASIAVSYPIGAVMMLQTGNPDVRFKPRLVEGVNLPQIPEPERLILDGQQRLTSLFQALFRNEVVTTQDLRGTKIKRWYYLDINKALAEQGDIDEAIISLPEDRRVRNFRGEITGDYSTPEKEYQAELFPLAQIFSASDWRAGYFEHWDYSKEKVKGFDKFEQQVIDRFKQYQLPLILLRKETSKEAVCQVFEKVNTGGVSLTVFELLTATYATDDFSLRKDWEERERLLQAEQVLRTIRSDDFLQAIALLTTWEGKGAISCKRRDILRLSLADYQRWADPVTQGFTKGVAKFLRKQYIFHTSDIPYRTQLVPLAAIFAALGDKAESAGVDAKLSRWFWSGIFGELYGGAIESRFARDLPEVLEWLDGKAEPSTVRDANFVAGRLATLRTRNSAAYKGVHALLMRDGCQDFRTGDPITVQQYFEDRVDIHHIFPKDWCRQQGIAVQRYDSIVNKTPLAAKTNRKISNNAPSTYLLKLEQQAEVDSARIDAILASHVIDAATLRRDDFDAFFQARQSALLERIERAMGKPIARDLSFSEEEA